MRLLLDTPALVWWLIGDERLPPQARDLVADPANEVFVSAASAWAIATKHRIGRMPEAAFLTADAAAIIADQGFTELPISIRHGQIAGSLPPLDADPYLRALVAQAIAEDLAVVSEDARFDGYGVSRLW